MKEQLSPKGKTQHANTFSLWLQADAQPGVRATCRNLQFGWQGASGQVQKYFVDEDTSPGIPQTATEVCFFQLVQHFGNRHVTNTSQIKPRMKKTVAPKITTAAVTDLRTVGITQQQR